MNESNRSLLAAVALACGTLLMGACAKQAPPAAPSADTAPTQETGTAALTEAPAPAPAAAAEPERVTALVALLPTKGHRTSGTLNFEVTPGGNVSVNGQLGGLTPNAEHGFHIHEKGDGKSPDGSSAGAHFNPDMMDHGNPESGAHHAGDMLNIKADATGNATVKLELKGVTLRDGGPKDLIGKGVIVHEKADDYKSQPAGDSGARVACGSIM